MWGSGAGGVQGHLISFVAAAPSSVLAFCTTIHLSLALLRRERSFRESRLRLVALPSFAWAASPWLLPSPVGLAIGIVSHLAWFLACEKLLPVAAPAERPVAPVPPPAGPPATATPFSIGAGPRALPPGFAPARVLAVFEETPDIRTFRLARPAGFEFRAGQFLSLKFEAEGKPAVRCYTISSAPEARGYLEITVKRQGRVSGALHERLRPGSLVPVRGPGGKFCYPEADGRPVVLIGGGVGVTPLMSMLRHAAAREPERSLTLLYSVRSEGDVAFRAELDSLARRESRLRVVVAVTRGCENPGFFPGRIDERLLRSVVADPPGSLFFLCGPLPMIDGMKALLASAGVPDTQVHSEAFEAAVAWAAAATPANRGAAAAGAVVRTSARCVLELARTGKRVSVPASQSLLEAAEEAGASIDSSCRSGSCGTCRTRLLRGRTAGEAGCLSAAERAEGWVLPCVAMAETDCALDA